MKIAAPLYAAWQGARYTRQRCRARVGRPPPKSPGVPVGRLPGSSSVRVSVRAGGI